MAGQNYRDLMAWQKAMDLVDLVYKVTRQFPKDELYGLSNQLRRAAVSIPSNIAEGQGRRTDPEFAQFLSIAHGSIREVETQIMIARRQDYIPEAEVGAVLNLCSEAGRLIKGLMNKLSNG